MNVLGDLYWGGLTILLEAEGESEQGKLGVAWVLTTRLEHERHRDPAAGLATVALRPAQFSCFNTNSPRRALIANAERHPLWEACCRAFASAYFGLVPDPSHGATHYLRADLDPKPSWFDPSRVTATIGHHVFLRLP
jgi:N-acetylmuramoyl-L-alanine amidase